VEERIKNVDNYCLIVYCSQNNILYLCF